VKIKNAIIITDSDSELRMTLAEQADFTGNVVFARSNLPENVAAALDKATGHSSKADTAPTDGRRVVVEPELVR
jgi:hypothetical protein